ncbi:F-box only protein 27 isoform X2 [Pelobates fuscus]|uniref:F-box only protein 27 isoform X2 n=1 Tax=Pelobates fuscus TaxID=191477 RepID=UPI002FE4C5E6
MGQSGSNEGPSATIQCVTRDFLQVRFDLEPFPDEILQKILSFLPPRELVTRCRLVSRRWKHLVDSPTLWKLKYGFDPWNVIHGGDGWVVENNRCPVEGAESQTCFVTSFFWCSKSQTIDLLKEGFCEHYLDVHQPPIAISDWVAGREDCGCMYEINVHLLAADRQSIKTFSNPTLQIDQWNNQIYHQVSHVFENYGPGVRFVQFSHKGKDTLFWKGWYRARFTNTSVTVRCNVNENQRVACEHSAFHWSRHR